MNDEAKNLLSIIKNIVNDELNNRKSTESEEEVRDIVNDELDNRKEIEFDEEKIRKTIKEETKYHRAGMTWASSEDKMLEIEFSAAVKQIAENHKRTTDSIKAKISQQALLMY